mmetsp:Transcript_30470/g.81165  ORF Transcript_30470/g.81165 Transcript_30470/m.81165 type:complete len:98 (-) Transcript_30470:3024-3317(-)
MRGCHFGIVEATRQGERSAAQIGDSRIANPAEEGNGGHRGGVGWGCAATKGGGEGFHCGEGQIQAISSASRADLVGGMDDAAPTSCFCYYTHTGASQ